MSDEPLPAEVDEKGSKKKGSKKKGCLITFLIVAIVVVIALGIGGYFIYRQITGFVFKFTEKYVEAGYTKQTGQTVLIEKELEGDYLYLCQTFTLNANLNGNLALFCQHATISADIAGDVDAQCQLVRVTEGAHMHGGLNLMCQTAEIRGTVDGEITGKCQALLVPEECRDRVNVLCQAVNYIKGSAPVEERDSL